VDADHGSAQCGENAFVSGPGAGKRPRYVVLKELRGGGGGTVAVVVDVFDGMRKVLKVAPVASGASWRRALHRPEFQFIKDRHHPHLVRLFEYGELDAGFPFLTVEFVPAASWRRLASEEVEAAFFQTVSTVSWLHEQDIAHGNLKPSNLLVEKTDGSPALKVKITDPVWFRCAGPEKRSSSGGVYAAPEVEEGGRPGVAGDIFSVGVLMTEVLGRVRLGKVESSRELSRGAGDIVRGLDGRLPEELLQLLKAMLSERPGSRPSSMKEVEETLASLFPAAASSGAGTEGEFFPWRPARAAEVSALLAEFKSAVGESTGRGFLVEAPAGGYPEIFAGELGKSCLAEGFRVIKVSSTWAKVSAELKRRRRLIERSLSGAARAFSAAVRGGGGERQLAGEVVLFLPQNRCRDHRRFTGLMKQLESCAVLCVVGEEGVASLGRGTPSPAGHGFTLKKLGPVSPAETKGLLRRALRSRDVPPRLPVVLAERGRGNAELMHRLLRAWIRAGVLEKENGSWSFAEAKLKAAARETDLASMRWRELNEGERGLVKLIGVLESPVPCEAIAELPAAGRHGTETVLDRLVEKGWAVREGDSFVCPSLTGSRFVRSFVKGSERVCLHRVWAGLYEKRAVLSRDWAYHLYHGRLWGNAYRVSSKLAERLILEKRYRDALPVTEFAWRSAEKLGWEGAAARFLLRNGQCLMGSSGDVARAVRCFERALALRGAPRAEILAELAWALQRRNRYEEAHRVSREALALAERKADRTLKLRILNDQAWIVHLLQATEPALEILDRVEKQASADPGQVENLAVCLCRKGGILVHTGRVGAGRVCLRKSLELGRRNKIEVPWKRSLLWLGLASIHAGYFEDAERYFRRLLFPEKKRDKGIEGLLALGWWGGALFFVGRRDEAQRVLNQILPVLRRATNRTIAASVLQLEGLLELYAGNFAKGEKILARVYRTARQGWSPELQSQILCRMSHGPFARGDYRRAERLCLKSLQVAEKCGSARDQSAALRQLGRVKFAQGDYGRSVEAFSKADSLAAATSHDRFALLGQANLACALVLAGRSGEAEGRIKRLKRSLRSLPAGRISLGIRLALARAFTVLGRYSEAWSVLRHCEGLAEEYGSEFSKLQVQLELGRFDLAVSETGPSRTREWGRPEKTIARLSSLVTRAREMGAVGIEREAAGLLNRAYEFALKSLRLQVKRFSRVSLLGEAVRAVASSGSAETLLRRILESFLRATGLERGAIVLRSAAPGRVEVLATAGADSARIAGELTQGTSPLAWVMKTHEPFFGPGAYGEGGQSGDGRVDPGHPRAVVCLPIRVRRGVVVGALYGDRCAFGVEMGELDREATAAYAHLAGIALEAAALHRVFSRRFSSRDPGADPFHQILRPASQLGCTTGKLGNIVAELREIASTGEAFLLRGERGVGKSRLAEFVHFEAGGRPDDFVGFDSSEAGEVAAFLSGRIPPGSLPAFRELVSRVRDGTVVVGHWEKADPRLRRTVSGHMQASRSKPARAGKAFGGRVILELEEAPGGRVAWLDDWLKTTGIREIEVPPLRERSEEVQPLAESFIEEFCVALGLTQPEVPRFEYERLLTHGWPGNIVELRACVGRSVVASAEGGRFRFLLSPDPSLQVEGEKCSMDVLVDRYKSALVRRALESARWNTTRAARMLGVSESTLRSRMKQLGIRRPDSRDFAKSRRRRRQQ